MKTLILAVVAGLAGCTTLALPHPEVDDYAMTLIRGQLAQPGSYFAANRRIQPVFVSVGKADITRRQIQGLADTEVAFAPGSQWQQGLGMQLHIHDPVKLSDGAYSVTEGFYCHERCGATVQAIMGRNDRGWYLLSTRILDIW